MEKTAMIKKSYGEEPDYGKDSYDKKSHDKDPVYGMDSYDKKSYGEEPEYGMDSYEKKSYGSEPEYGTQYSSYGKDNKDKSKDSVDIQKLKCKNTNINLNGIEANIGGAVDSVGAAAASEGIEQASAVNGERNNHEVKKFLGKDFDVVCISKNNNNNEGAGTGDGDDETDPCGDEVRTCFTDFLTDPAVEATLIAALSPNGAGITIDVGTGISVEFNSFAEICLFLQGLEADTGLIQHFLSLILLEIGVETFPLPTLTACVEAAIAIATDSIV
jgi:hypothetical protein